MTSLNNVQENGRKIYWDDGNIRHAVTGDEVHPGIVLLWTKCGKHDVPANQGYTTKKKDEVFEITCAHCLAAE